MKEITSRLLSAREGFTRMRVTWEVTHGWFERFVMSLPKTSRLSNVYERVGTQWRCYQDRAPIPSKVIAQLDAIEVRLLKDNAKRVGFIETSGVASGCE